MKVVTKIIFGILIHIVIWGCNHESRNEIKIGEIETPTMGWHKSILKIVVKDDSNDRYGVCFAKSPRLPTIDDLKAPLNADIVTLTDLEENTTYNWSVYALKAKNILYTEVQNFTTRKTPTISITPPKATATSVGFSINFTNLDSQDAIKIGYNGIEKTIKNDGSATMQLDTTITGLCPETNIYVCIYLENNIGERIEQNDVKFSTLKKRDPIIKTGGYEYDNTNDAVRLWGEILDKGDPPLTECGFLLSQNSGNLWFHSNGKPYDGATADDPVHYDNNQFYIMRTVSETPFFRAYAKIKHNGCIDSIIYGDIMKVD